MHFGGWKILLNLVARRMNTIVLPHAVQTAVIVALLLLGASFAFAEESTSTELITNEAILESAVTTSDIFIADDTALIAPLAPTSTETSTESRTTESEPAENEVIEAFASEQLEPELVVPEETVDEEQVPDAVLEIINDSLQQELETTTTNQLSTILIPVITSDRDDYHPTETAYIFGGMFEPLTNLILKIFGGSEENGNYIESEQTVTTDENGSFITTYVLDEIFRPLYTVVAKSVTDGVELARMTFTDASLDTAQCRNGSSASPNNCTNLGGGSGWVSGNANAQQSHFKEGDMIPYRAVINGATTGTTYAVSVLWDTRKGGINATDYIGYARTIAEVVDPCDGAGSTVANCPLPPINSGSMPAGVNTYDLSNYITLGTTGTPTTLQCNGLKTGTTGAISSTPGCTSYSNLRAASSGGTRGGSIVVVGATLQDVRLPRQDALSTNPATTETTSSRVVFYVTATSNSNIVISFGGHIASRVDWGSLSGTPQSAGGISGSPYHLSKEGLCNPLTSPTDCTTGVGQGDLQLSAGAVVVPNNITIRKVMVGGTGTFTFTGTPSGTISTNNGTLTASPASGNGSVTESTLTGWALTNLTCTTAGGATATPNVGTRTVSYSMPAAGGGNVDCTFTNTLQQGSIKIVKNTVGGNGTFAFTGNTGVTSLTTTAGTAQQTVSVNAGSYNITETVPTGWDLTSATCDNNSTPASITVTAGQTTTCTFTNTKKGQLTVQKTTFPGGDTTSFAINATGNGTITGDGAGSVTDANDKAYEVTPGTYSVTETVPNGWTQTSNNCTSVAVAAGESKTCQIVNTKKGLITIEKQVVGADKDFGFTGAIAATLGDNETATLEVTPGNYSVTEGGDTAYALTSLVCNDNDSTGNTGTRAASFVIGAGENVTCVFTNSELPKLTLVKTVTNDNGGTAATTNFQGKINGNSVPWATAQTLTTGSFTASETNLANYTASAWGGDCAPDGSVTLNYGDNKTCTITNDDNAPKLHLRKVVVNDNGGGATVADFTLTANGTGANDISGTSPVDSGADLDADTFALSETNLAGYTASAWVCTGGTQNGANITLGLGQEATCTITNDDQQAYVIVDKTVLNNNGGSAGPNDFLLTVDGNAVTDAVAYAVNPGTHTAGETNLPGYTASAWGGDCGTDAKVTVALGETKTCTITNDDQQAHITVTKVVTNDNGGDAAPNDFALKLAGNAVSSGVQVPVNPGTYSASETNLSGYTFEGYSGDCNSNGSITVALGESKNCTLTNNDQQSYVIINKTVINDNGGTAAPDDFLLKVDTTAALDEVKVPVNPGVHKASESLLAGYVAGDWGTDCDANGDLVVALGETKTCTITNNDIQPKLTVTKVVINHGQTKSVTDFPLFVDATGVTSGVQNGFNTGVHTVSETGDANYTATITGDCDANGSITLGLADVKACTITNEEKLADITVKKVVINHGQNKSAADFAPYKVDTTTVTLDQATVFNSGNHTVSEVADPNYTATFSGDCNSSGVVALGSGQHKTCTITNEEKLSKIIVEKEVKNHGGDADTSDFGPYKVGTTEVQLDTETIFNSGSYVVTEAVSDDYTATFSGACDANGNVTLLPGTTVTCHIKNEEKPAKLVVTKVVIADNGGTKVVADFPLFVGITGVTSGVTNTFDSGSYIVSETSDANYTATISGDCDLSTGSVTLTPGETKSCTITNNDKAPKLTLVKEVINDNGGTAKPENWTLTATGYDVDSPDAGTYQLSESNGPGGYTQTSLTCDNATGPVTSVTLGLGDDVTCTFVNDDIAPKLHLRKVVINDNGGAATLASFTLTADGTGANDLVGMNPVDSGLALKADTFVLSETNVTGYTASAWTCVGGTQTGSSIILGLAQEATCTITNDDQPGMLKIVKESVGGNGTFIFTVNGPTASTPSITTLNNTGDTGLMTVNAGSYAVVETVPAGWDLTLSSCTTGTPASFSVANGVTVTCTFKNTKKGHLIVEKTTLPAGDTTSFSINATGNGIISGSAAGAVTDATDKDYEVTPGTYAVSETIPSGWKQNSNTCTGVVIAAGETKTCTIVNEKLASLTIVKDASPNDVADFVFTSALLGSFTLDDDAGVVDPAPGEELNEWSNSKTFTNVNAGAYTVSETQPNQYWKMKQVTCANSAGGAYTNLTTGTNSATITLTPGVNVTCTYVNEKLSPTRTLGFWQTHTTYTTSIFNTKGPFFIGQNVTVGATTHKGKLTAAGQVFGAFFAPIPKTTIGLKRSAVDQARVQLLQQLMAAKLNCQAFGCTASVQSMIATADSHYLNGTAAQIIADSALLDAYNNSGDTVTVGSAGSATPSASKTAANLAFWDTP